MARSLLAPAVLQVGAADCGPAALASALLGFGRQVTVEELRERLHSDEEGTSIGDLERVAREYGLAAEEVMVPGENLLAGHEPLPAIAVFLLPDGRTHFVLLWRRWGSRFLAMDPATGLTVLGAELGSRLLVHEHLVPAEAWREWAASDEFAKPLLRRLVRLGLPPGEAQERLARALADPGVTSLAALDAAVRCAAELVSAGALERKVVADRLDALVAELVAAENPATVLSRRWWSALPQADGALLLRGALLVRLAWPSGANAAGTRPSRPANASWAAARQRRPFLLAAALTGAVAAVEGLALAGLAQGFDGGRGLAVLGAAAATFFLAAGGLLDLFAQRRALRAGRGEEMAARIDLAERLPELPDAVIASRSRADLADRIHGAVYLRQGPYIGGGVARALAELLTILLLLLHLAPDAAVAGFCGSLLVVFGAERSRRRLLAIESRRRLHSARLATLALDAARGNAVLAAFGLAPALRAEFEHTLGRWSRVIRERALARGLASIVLGGGSALAAGWMLAVGDAAALLLVGWWALRIPALGDELVGRAADLAAVRAVKRRLSELRGPARGDQPVAAKTLGPGAIELRGVSLQLGGNEILREIDLVLQPGCEVALVGASGAGKSSLGRLLLGIHPCSRGEMLVSGKPVTDPRELRCQSGYIDAGEALPNLPLAELLVRADTAAERACELTEALALGGLSELAERGGLGRRPSELGLAEQQRVRVARGAGPAEARLVVIDESFRGLPFAAGRDLLARLRARSPRAVLLHITHDLESAAAADLVVVLAEGRVVECGPPAALVAAGGAFAASAGARRDPLGQWPAASWRRGPA